jgi:hypothetical protein
VEQGAKTRYFGIADAEAVMAKLRPVADVAFEGRIPRGRADNA